MLPFIVLAILIFIQVRTIIILIDSCILFNCLIKSTHDEERTNYLLRLRTNLFEIILWTIIIILIVIFIKGSSISFITLT